MSGRRPEQGAWPPSHISARDAPANPLRMSSNRINLDGRTSDRVTPLFLRNVQVRGDEAGLRSCSRLRRLKGQAPGRSLHPDLPQTAVEPARPVRAGAGWGSNAVSQHRDFPRTQCHRGSYGKHPCSQERHTAVLRGGGPPFLRVRSDSLEKNQGNRPHLY